MPITNSARPAPSTKPSPPASTAKVDSSSVSSTATKTAKSTTGTTENAAKKVKANVDVKTTVATLQTQAATRQIAGAKQGTLAASVNHQDITDPSKTAKSSAKANPWRTPTAVRRGLNAPVADGTYRAADPQIMQNIKAGQPGSLVRGQKGPGVRETQTLLNKFGFGLAQDSMLGPRTEAAVKQFQKASGLPETGAVDAATYQALQTADPQALAGQLNTTLPGKMAPITSAKMPSADRQQAIRDAILNDPQIPDSWATDPSKLAAINRIVEKESGWKVGIPNYTIRNAGLTGDQAARLLQTHKNLTGYGASSSAMGLFQLIGTNMDKYQPGGRTTIGNAQAEMQGGLRYMMDRYGTPERALAFHNRNNWW